MTKLLANRFSFMDLASGKILSNRYRIIQELGQGGFGQTFLAQDHHLPSQQKCVIKQLKPQSNDPTTLQTARRLFETEAKILHELGTHPQIPQLYAYFEENQDFFLVQEYVEGEELAKEINSPTVIGDEQKVLAILYQILEILVFVHQKNVIHRDINPYNLIRRKKDGKLVLIDFGAVKKITTQVIQEGKSISTIAIGTPGYFPSEQAHGHPRFSSDIYAVGMIGLQALTGYFPEDLSIHPQTGEINWQHLVTTSAELSYVLDRMLRYDFRQRYASAQEAITDISKLLKHHQKTIYAVSSRQPSSPLSGLIKGLIVITILGIGAGVYLAFDSWMNSKNSLELYQQATTLYELKRYEESLQTYQKVLQINPKYAEAFKGKGDTLFALGKYKEALEAYEKAIQLQRENYWQAWLGRGKTLQKLGKNQEAIETFNKVLQMNSNAWEALQGIATIYLDSKQYSEARQTFEQLLILKPDDEKIWYQQGFVLQNLGNYEEALKAYEKAIELKSDYAQAWYQKGNNLSLLNQYQEAIDAYAKAVQFQPQLAPAWYSQGILLQKLGQNEKALEAFNKATEANNSYYEAWYQKGWVLHQLGRYREAITAYEKAIQINPKSYQAWKSLGNSWYQLREYKQAITAYQKSLELKKDDAQTWKSLGNSWFNLKEYTQAITAYDQALRYQPNDSEIQKIRQEAEYRKQETSLPLEESRQEEENDTETD